MTNTSPLNDREFRDILAKNIILPLATGLASAVLFVILINYLLSSFKWVEHTESVISRVNEVARLTVDMQTGMRGYLIVGDEDFLKPYRLASPKIDAEIDILKELVADNRSQVDRLQRLQVMISSWRDYAESNINLRRNNQDYQKNVRLNSLLEFEEIRKEFADFQNAEKLLLQDRNSHAKNVTLIAVIAYLFAIVVMTGLLSVLGRRELIKLSSIYSNTLAEREEHAHLLERQSWQRAGQARLAEQTIGQSTLPLLGRTVLNFLADYLNAAVASMYVRNEDDGALRRVAIYGVDKEAEQSEQELDSNQGLVAQSVFSKRMIHLADVPENYLKVSSGLGSSAPRHIVLQPISCDGAVNGVLELGFLQAPTEQSFEFLKLVSENIGSMVEAAVYRRRLQYVLEETQQLNEELQSQQEELRTSNEELEEQSRALAASQALLEDQKAELEQTNEKLVSQAQMLDQNNIELNSIQVELEERAQELQRASQYKSEFLANMSHELRTPLNSSMILAKLLSENQKGNLTEEQVQFAQSIYSAGSDLLNLINDILDISKVEAGKLELAPEHVSVSRLVSALRMVFEPLVQQKQLHYVVDIAPHVPESIFTDSQRLEQILKNLLSNALKFTDKGEISLSVSSPAEGTLAFAVKDSGIGISKDQQQIIFEAFHQADGGINRRYGGTGLGLSISRDLAALLGGSIAVDSAPGKGSTFTLFIPADLAADSKAIVASPIEAAAVSADSSDTAPANSPAFADDRLKHVETGRTVLVIEDDAEFARILYDLAHELHYRCLVTHSAIEGLQVANDFLPDAILLDIGLPDISGMSVLQKLKTNPNTRHIPVHIVSAADRTETALKLGAVGYAVKPATRERLQQVFAKLESKFTQKVKKILLVEDDVRQRQSVIQLLNDVDVEITAVELGEEAIALLHTTIFDCMVVDLKLPDMQGHELLQRMSVEEICSFPPVIVYTGRDLTREEESELLKYSRAIIIKGARSPERLLDEVTLFLHTVESEMSLERQSMLKAVRSRDRVLEKRRILLVDDDVRNIFAMSGALEQKGVLVEIARNGLEAVNRLEANPNIDLVLMDVMMPVMDGLEATRRIRSDARFQQLPIIAITAKAMKDDQEQCLNAGASDYLAKPIDIERLYSLLRVWISNMERL